MVVLQPSPDVVVMTGTVRTWEDPDPLAAPVERGALAILALVVGVMAPSLLGWIAGIGVSLLLGAAVAAAGSGADLAVPWRTAVRLARADIGAIRIALRRRTRRFTLRIECHRVSLNEREIPITDLELRIDGFRLDLAGSTYRMDQGLTDVERFVLESALATARRSVEARAGGAPPVELQRLREPVSSDEPSPTSR